MWVVILLVVVVVIFLAMRKSGDNVGSSSSSSSGNLDFAYLDTKLDTLYDAYLELCQKGCTNVIYQITLYPTSSNSMGIDVQLDGSWFLSGMKNDILTYCYTLPAGEDPSTWHIRREEFPVKSVNKSSLSSYLSSYKQRNSDKGDFLNLLRTA